MSERGTNSERSNDDPSIGNLNAAIAQTETRVIQLLRISVIGVLLVTATLVCVGIYVYTSAEERQAFESHFEDNAQQVIKSFSKLVERNLEAAAWMSTALTSHALQSNQSFPFVTLPHFEQQGSHFRALSGSHVVHYLPLVGDRNREEYEQYAIEYRSQIDEAFEQDMRQRIRQDQALGAQRQLQESLLNVTVLEDGTGYHPKIWRTGAIVPPGDEPKGSGPFLPMWQRSPIDGAKQSILNMNFAQSRALRPDLLKTMTKEKKAVLNTAAVPIPEIKERLVANLRLSQYREHVEDYVDGLSTFLAYPVFDSFEEDRQVTGVLATNIYYKILFTNLLPSLTEGIICVVENSFNQSFTYRVDGDQATLLGMGAMNNPKYDHLEVSIDVGEYLQSQANVQKRAYATVPLSNDASYTLRVYPSSDMEDAFITNQPLMFTLVAVFAFAFVSLLFLAFSHVVERRQKMMIAKVLENAEKAANAERELNEFLSHEVRNPLSAAMIASTMVSEALNDPDPLPDEETKRLARDDVKIINSSLTFINDFLRSMLDIHRASGKHIKVEKSPTDLLLHVLEPVTAMICKRVANFETVVDCPANLTVMTNPIRLKEVMLNLLRNSSKFVQHGGFVRLRAAVEEGQVKIFVQDSGPGIPPEKRSTLFSKYQSLDMLSQGTGLGLNLSKTLMKSLEGDIWLDETYDSGVKGFPGACFVVELKCAPLHSSSVTHTESESYIAPEKGGRNSIEEDDEKVEAMEFQPCFVGLDRKDEGCQACVVNLVSEDERYKVESTTSHDAFAPPKTDDKLPDAVSILHADASPATPTELPTELSVLFVDDDAVLRKLFMRAMKKAQPSWHVEDASSGEAALEICETREFDLIFLDQYMASVHQQLLGTETCEALRKRGVNSVICGLSANNIGDAFMSSGANDFILKPMPCKAEDLRQVLRRLLMLKRIASIEPEQQDFET